MAESEDCLNAQFPRYDYFPAVDNTLELLIRIEIGTKSDDRHMSLCYLSLNLGRENRESLAV